MDIEWGGAMLQRRLVNFMVLGFPHLHWCRLVGAATATRAILPLSHPHLVFSTCIQTDWWWMQQSLLSFFNLLHLVRIFWDTERYHSSQGHFSFLVNMQCLAYVFTSPDARGWRTHDKYVRLNSSYILYLLRSFSSAWHDASAATCQKSLWSDNLDHQWIFDCVKYLLMLHMNGQDHLDTAVMRLLLDGGW